MTDAIHPDTPATPPRPTFCRRCGAMVSIDAACACGTPPALPVGLALKPGPSLRAALWLYFSMLGLSAIAMAYVRLSKAADAGAVFDIVLSCAFAAVVLPWAVVYARSVGPVLRPRGAAVWYAAAVVAPVGTFALAAATLWVFKNTVDLPIIDMSADYRREGYAFGWLVLASCVIPAVFEEIAFRGIIYDGLSRHLTALETALVSALIFGILHLSILSLPHLVTIGFILALFRAKTGSLLPGMLAHFLHNLLFCGWDWSVAS